ncbi:bifunctional diguanylate cyclase/phosphodiesterase [Paraburkholderia terrae]|uniref:GGDEF domain-containing protein n=1 Tax=Paraburkholderia terrae TaxID=311230 RepID=A0A2I8EZJ1_9BURK|nr:GGDEF domain-containing protein [Paraburkholderia terrae]AUT64920.1 GGDEF domain-containing protein [Paraburkholderia terrae]
MSLTKEASVALPSRPDPAEKLIEGDAVPWRINETAVVPSTKVADTLRGTAIPCVPGDVIPVDDIRSRALHLTARCSHAMLRATDEQALLAEICRLAVEAGGYTVAWAGTVHPERGGNVIPTAWSSGAERYIAQIRTGEFGPTGCPAAEAIREQRTIIYEGCDKNHLDPRETRNVPPFVRCIALPLICQGECIGGLAICGSTESRPNDNEIILLEEMATDLAFAIWMLRLRKEHEEAKQRLDHLTHHDQLTGVWNRFHLRSLFPDLTRAATWADKQLPMLLLDIDNFRTINDAWGHDCGDRLLVEAASRLTQYVGDQGIVCRHGGDEFAVILHSLDAGLGLNRFIKGMVAIFDEPFDAENCPVEVTASIGIACYPAHAETLRNLTRAADAALQQIKESGKNGHHVFNASMLSEAEAQRTLRAQLRQAIRNEEFVLYYQPKYDVQQKKIVSVEALIRWRHPERGLVGPGSFIPIAEKTGLIVPIGEWVLKTACKQLAAWKHMGLPLQTVAVNVSAVQLRRGNLPQTVSGALRGTGLRATNIELELTESMFLGETEPVFRALRGLRALGVKLSLDDFGTGYSSLSYLKSLRIDRLKIDQSFIRDIPGCSDAEAIVKAIVQLSRNLNLAVTAEGVETLEQRQVLEQLECDEIQGYLIGRPVPAEELTSLLAPPPAMRRGP